MRRRPAGWPSGEEPPARARSLLLPARDVEPHVYSTVLRSALRACRLAALLAVPAAATPVFQISIGPGDVQNNWNVPKLTLENLSTAGETIAALSISIGAPGYVYDFVAVAGLESGRPSRERRDRGRDRCDARRGRSRERHRLGDHAGLVVRALRAGRAPGVRGRPRSRGRHGDRRRAHDLVQQRRRAERGDRRHLHERRDRHRHDAGRARQPELGAARPDRRGTRARDGEPARRRRSSASPSSECASRANVRR